MGSHQADLCLSCGVPFRASVQEVDYFRGRGNRSILFLNHEYQNNSELRRKYDRLKFTGEVHASHVFHDSHHIQALRSVICA